MNFLRQSFSSISEPSSNPSQQHVTGTHSERDRDASLQAAAAAAAAPPAHAARTSSSFDSDGEDARPAPIPSASAVDSLRTRNHIAIEDHMDVPKDGGGILIPCRELPTSWHVHGDMTSISNMDRDFVFPGECVSIVVYVSSHDPSMPQIITPFRVAAMLEKVNLKEKGSTRKGGLFVAGDSSKTSLEEDKQQLVAEKVELSSLKNGSSNAEKVLMIEEHKKRSAALVHLFQNSHFFTRIVGAEEQVSQEEKFFGQSAEELDDGTFSTSSEHKKLTKSVEPVPVAIEGPDFNPRYAGGVARNARCYSFDNGDIAVVLQVSVATNLKGDVVLEVLQFQQAGQSETISGHGNEMERIQAHQSHINSSDQLLQWILPLDNPPSSPLSGMAATSTSFVNSSPQRPSFTNSSGSSLFSFANLRTYSSGSSSHSAQSSSTVTSQQSSTYGLEEWDRSASQRSVKGHSMGKEGLLSFRGAQLEPQRFSVHCGLEGLYVPGWRWRRELDVVEPVAIESYIADCNTKDLICVTVENIIPDRFPEICVVIDSISIVCQTPRFSSNASPTVPIACVEVGENHKLPGLSLRPGEQHSFILKPSNSSSHPSAMDKVKAASMSPSYEPVKPTTHSLQGSVKQKVKDHDSSSLLDTGNFFIVVSCRCSHTESRLHFKHPIKWQPRSPRDLLLSVSLESVSKPEIPSGSLPTFSPKVVTVQATNLTSDSLHLTLLAPSSKYSGPTPPLPVPNNLGLPRMSSFMSFHEKKEWPIAKNKENGLDQDKVNSEASPSGRPSSLQRSLSLPPAKPIESIMGITPRVVKERAISAADIAAENSSARTHLWLQSIIPLGYVPPQSTTAIRCELLPLTDGIISLDTLHISTKDQDVYYPEQALQIYATSSIGIGIP